MSIAADIAAVNSHYRPRPMLVRRTPENLAETKVDGRVYMHAELARSCDMGKIAPPGDCPGSGIYGLSSPLCLGQRTSARRRSSIGYITA